MNRCAVVVSAHGFGHAARATAVADSLLERRSDLRFEILTGVPSWFFASDVAGLRVHPADVDVGLVQETPLEADLDATAVHLDRLYGHAEPLERIVRQISELRCTAVVCDISPLGLLAAQRLGLPSALVENFTWDWIYEPYLETHPALGRHLSVLRDAVSNATVRVQTRPVCRSSPGSFEVAPVARRRLTAPATVRRRLGVGDEAPLVLLSMGGVGWRTRGADRLAAAPFHVVAPGSGDRELRRGRLLLLPHRSRYHHPDLVAAADLVVGKLGYSTVAEATAAGTRFLYVERPGFRESPVLEEFVQGQLTAAKIPIDALADGSWIDAAQRLLGTARRAPADAARGAAEAARHIDDRLLH